MPLPTMSIPDFSGTSKAVNLANSGRQAAADSAAAVLSNEDLAAIGNLTETAPATDTASSGLNGRLQRIAQRLTSLIALLPTSLGTKTAANSLAVTLASDGPFSAVTGTPTDAAVANGAAGTLSGYLRAMKDVLTDTTTPSPVKIDQTTPGTTDAVTVKTPADMIPFTPTLDTAIYAAGDVLFTTAALTGLTRANDQRAMLQSLTVMDKSKQKPAFSIFFYKTNVTSAAANAANNLSDADAVSYMGHVSIAAADYKDLANNSFLTYAGAKSPGLLLEAATGTSTVYAVGVLDAGTPTFAVGDLQIGFGVVQS